MCRMATIIINGRTIKVADIKARFIKNIADAAAECDYIDKVVLFGSSITERSTKDSDIDIAVFGRQYKSKALISAKYKRFTHKVRNYEDGTQEYDILYFKSDGKYRPIILNRIDDGEVLYERKQ